MILAADIGGTKTDLILVDETDLESIIHKQKFLNTNYQSFEEIVKEAVGSSELTYMILGVAGPVIDGTVKMTNIDWELSEESLSLEFDVQVTILNDLEAVGYFISQYDSSDAYVVRSGKSGPRNIDVVVGIGTGLGVAMISSEDHPMVFVSEGGHIGFSPRSQFDEDIFRFLKTKYSHISFEMVCSGIGLQNLINFIMQTPKFGISSDYCAELLLEPDPVKTLLKRAEGNDEVAKNIRELLDKVGVLLGNFLGDIALLYLPDRIFLWGGLADALLKYYPRISEGFLDKGELSYRIQDTPIFLLSEPSAGVFGLLEFFKSHNILS